MSVGFIQFEQWTNDLEIDVTHYIINMMLNSIERRTEPVHTLKHYFGTKERRTLNAAKRVNLELD